MTPTKGEFQRRARVKKARAWAEWLVSFSGLDVVGASPAGWRATIRWVLGLTPDAWARMSTHSRQRPPSQETVRYIVARLGDLGVKATHGN